MKKEKLIFGFAFGLLNIDDINKKELNDDFFIKSLELNIDIIKEIPKQYLTTKVCDKIIEDGYISTEYMSILPADYIKKLMSDPSYYYLISEIKEELLTKEFCENAVKKDGSLIIYVPDKFMSKELALLAFKTNVYTIEKIKDKYKTRELCIRSLRITTFAALKYVPINLIDQEICDIAIYYNKNNIKYIPKKYMKKEIIEKSLDMSGLYLEFIPKDLITKELCDKALEKNPLALEFIPRKYKDIEMCYKAILKYPLTIKYIPKEYLKRIKQKLTNEFYNDYKKGINIYEDLQEMASYIEERDNIDKIKRKSKEKKKSLEKK